MADQNIIQLVDALGRVLEVKTPDVEKALEQLAGAMNSAVSKINKLGEGGKTDTFFDLITDKESKVKKFSEYLQSSVPDAFKKLVEDVDEVSDSLKGVAKSLENIKKNAKGRGAGGTTSGDSKCPCQDILNTISGNINNVYQTMTNNGVKLENSVTELLKSINRGIRGINSAMGKTSGGRGGYDVHAPMMSGHGPSAPVDLDVRPDILDAVPDVFGKSSEEFSTFNAEVDSALKRWTKYVRSLRWANEHFAYAVGTYAEKLEEVSKDDAVVKLEKSYRKLEKTFDNISKVEDDISIKDRKLLKQEFLRMKVIGEMVSQGRAEVGELEKQYKKVEQTINRVNKNVEAWRTKMVAVNMAGGLFISAFDKFTGPVMGGMLTDLNEWEKDSTRMATIMTGAIQRAGGESKVLVNQYRNLLEVSDEVIKQTHQFPRVVRKEWTKAIQKGSRELNETRETINSALSGAWQIGASAEGTADEFQKWNMYIGMSAQGSTALARTMTTVSKVTGVMGDNLLQAVSAAREIAQLMRDTGNYSQQTADSVVSWMASAQKFGVDKQVQNIFRAAQGGLEAFNEASSETRNLLASSGQLQNVLAGSADPDAVMKGVGEAIRKAIPANAFSQRDARGRPIGLPDLKKLSKAEISRIDLIMKKRFGMKLGEAVRMLEGIQDQNPEEKLSQIEKDLANPVLTPAEKEQLELQKKQLEIARDEKKFSKIMDSLNEMSEAGKMQGANLANMLRQGKMTETTFKNSVQDVAGLLSKKMERQGKTFKDAMGMTSEEFTGKMTGLIEGMRSGNVDSIRQFRELQMKMAEANKTADSQAKNNANNADRMESDQQRLQNQLQNIAKPLHTLAFQAPVWTWYLTTISGAVWSLVRMWKGGRISENMQKTADTLIQTIGTKGSGWVHDPYVEHFVKNIDRNLVGLGRHLTKGGFGGRKAGGIADSTATNITGGGLFGDLVNNIKRNTSTETKIDKTQEFLSKKSYLRYKKHIPIDKREVILLKKREMLWRKEWALAAKRERLLGKGGETRIPGQGVKGPRAELPKPKMKGADAILKGASKITAIAAAVVALGAVLILAAKAIMSLTGFDAKQAKEVAWVIGVVIGAGAGTLLAAAAAAKTMEFANKLITPKTIKDIYMGGVMLMAILPAILLLGLAVVAMGGLLSTVIEPKKAEEYSKAVSGILLSSAIIASSILLSAATLTVLGLLYPVAQYMLPLMLMGAIGLLILTPAMLGLAWAVLKMASIMNSMIDPKWAAGVATATADIMLAAAKIATAVVLGAASLMILSAMLWWAWIIVPLMVAGTVALLALTPAVMGMAWAVLKMAAIVNKMVDPKEAAVISKATADILQSAAKIAAAVVAGAASLMVLSVMLGLIWIILPLMVAGTVALLALTPAVVGMALAIINMAAKFSTVENVKSGTEAAKNLASVLESAAKIANAVVESRKAIEDIGGSWLSSIWGAITGKSFEKGGRTIRAMVPQTTELAKSVIYMAKEQTGGSVVKDGIQAAKDLSSVLESASKIANAVVESKKALEQLASRVWTGWIWFLIRRNTFLDGADALLEMTPQTVKLAGTIIDMASQLTANKINGVKAAKDLADLLEAAGKIANAIIESKKELDRLALMNIFSYWISMVLRDSRESITSTAKNIINGLIIPIMTQLPPSTDMADAAAKLKGVVDTLKLLPKFMQDLSDEMNTLGKAQYLHYDLGRKTRDFASWFYGVGRSVTWGILEPIQSFPNSSEVDQAKNTLSVLTESLADLMDVMYDLSDILEEMGSIGIDFSALESVGGVFKSGKLELVIQGKRDGFAGDQTENTQSWMDRMLGVFTGVHSPAVSGNGGLLRGMKKGFSTSLEKPMGSMTKATGKVGYGVNRLGGTITKFTQRVSGDVATKVDQMKELLHVDLVNILNQLRNAPMTGSSPDGDPLRKIVDNTNAMNVTLTGVEGHGSAIEDMMINKVLPHVERLVSVAVSQEERTAKPTTNNIEFDKQVQARVEQSRPSDAMTMSMEYLAAIAANTAATNESVQEAIEVLEDIRERLNAPVSRGGPVSTKGNEKPKSTPNYYGWQFGRFSDTSAKQRVNAGF